MAHVPPRSSSDISAPSSPIRDIEHEFRRDGVPLLLTLPAAAGIIGCHPDTLRLLIRQGRLQAVRPAGILRSGHYRILRHQLAVYLSGGDVGPRDDGPLRVAGPLRAGPSELRAEQHKAVDPAAPTAEVRP